ncbi:MAG: hypothetical protein JG759_691 [Thermoanaerobacter sp.]|nr:hypothetical protein [Thermoanaerobacter sp.]
MSYFLFALLIFIAFIKKDSKILAIFLLTLMWVLYGWNTGNADYINYNVAYYHNAISPINYNKEIAFQLLCKLFNKFGLDYNQFLVIISITGLVLITSTIRRYTKNVAFVLAMYFIFPFMLDVVQVRNFLAMAIVVFGLRFLIEKKKWGKVKYIILVLLASTFHYSALFYFIFLLKEVQSTKKLVYFSLFTTSICVVNSYTELIPTLAAKIAPNAKVYAWFTNRMNLGIFIALFVHAVTFLLVNYAYKRIKNAQIKYLHENSINSEKKYSNKSFLKPNLVEFKPFNINMNFVNFAYKVNIISSLVFPLYVFNMIFFRLYRNIFIINYILFSLSLFNVRYDKREKFLYGLLVFFYVILMAAYYIVIPHYDSVFSAVLQNNSLLGK